MDYGEILSRSWKIVWKFKVLWLFGFFAACGTSRGGNFNNTYRTSGNDYSGAPPNLPPAMRQSLYEFIRLFDDPAFIWAFLAVLFGILFVILLAQFIIATMGRIGLIKGAAQADAGAEKLPFGQLWRESASYFWRVFWLSLLIGAPIAATLIAIAVSFIITILPLADNNPNFSAFLILLPVLLTLFCVILLLSILLKFISTQAERAIVLENKSILDGLRRGWEVFTKNLGPILIIWIIQIAVGVAAGILIALPLLALLIPFFIGFITNLNNANFSFTPWLIAILLIALVYAPISWVANGILTAYLESVWTLTYLRITKPKPVEQIPPASPANA